MTGVGPGFGQEIVPVVHDHDRINATPIDRFTVAHVLAGCVLRGFDVPLIATLVLSVWFEIAENVVQSNMSWSIFPNTAPHDSLANSICDTVAVAAGWSTVDLLKR